MAGPTVGSVSSVVADDSGVWFVARADAPDEVVDVRFDGRRIWSLWLLRDSRVVDERRLADWPPVLAPFLDGVTRLSVVTHVDGEILFDEEVRFGGGRTDRIAVVNAEGKPLGLDKANKLTRTFDTRDAAQVGPLLDSIEEVIAAIADFGLTAFPAWGTLLGAVREGRLLGHDSDADLGYVSDHTHPVDVIRESFRLQRHLASLGYSTVRYSGIAFKIDVIESDGFKRGLDVFGGFLLPGDGDGDRPDMFYLMGEVGAPYRREWLFPMGTTTLEGRTLPAPAEPERLVEASYGPSWRVPDPAFRFQTPLATVRRLDGWFRGHRTFRDDWERHYSPKRSTPPQGRPSGLARTVHAEEPEDVTVLDLGGGRGRDALWLARAGHPVVVLDFVPWAAAAAVAEAEAEGLSIEVRPVNLNSLRSWLAVATRIALTPGPRTVLCRHVVDELTPRARSAAWRFCRIVLRGRGRLYLQTRDDHIDPDLVVAELDASGADIVSRGSDGGQTRLVVEWRS